MDLMQGEDSKGDETAIGKVNSFKFNDTCLAVLKEELALVERRGQASSVSLIVVVFNICSVASWFVQVSA